MSNLRDSQAFVMPNSNDAECSVLGSMIRNSSALNLGMEKLHADDFYYPHHAAIFLSMEKLYRKGSGVDLITLNSEIESSRQLENFGGAEYLVKLTGKAPVTVNFKDYVDILLEKSLRRKLILAANEIVENSYNQTMDMADVRAHAEKSLFDMLTKNGSSENIVHINTLLAPVYEMLEELFKNPGKISGVPTCFAELDQSLTGLHPGELILVGARPSMGKTSFAINIASQAASKGKSVAIFSLEMPNKQIVMRILCSTARVNMQNARLGLLKQSDWQKLADAGEVLYNMPIYIDDSASLTPSRLRSTLRRLKMDTKLDLVVIDYLQLMQADGRYDNRNLEVSEVSRRLKALALELELPIVACAQLSRDNTKRSDKRPMLSDLRDSGSIEQDADVVMFIHRPDYYDKGDENANLAEIIIAKQRNGPVGTVELYWQSELTLFEDKRIVN